MQNNIYISFYQIFNKKRDGFSKKLKKKRKLQNIKVQKITLNNLLNGDFGNLDFRYLKNDFYLEMSFFLFILILPKGYYVSFLTKKLFNY